MMTIGKNTCLAPDFKRAQVIPAEILELSENELSELDFGLSASSNNVFLPRPPQGPIGGPGMGATEHIELT